MNVNERTLAMSSDSAGVPPNGGSNPSDEQVEPTTTLSILSLDYKKHEDLKQMLDSNKDNLKLEAMRRIIGMIAKGKDAADLFPAVVKNVVSKSMEVKKLVYVYLMRYAEEQQDLALLSIATFQRGLKDPNQLIRASALRVLSSIRVPSIVSIMVLAIRDAVNDMSPYVRKTAANAIAKLHALDPELKEELVLIIVKLLADKTILVNGSAVQAFEQVCPERIDLIHKNYRRLCNLLVDIDEWGQVIVLNMLTRYARSQFLDPNRAVDDEEEDETSEKRTYVMDADHRLLLRCTKPLLQSRNSAVVMAVAQLYYYVAPQSEIPIVAKALVRLLRHHREIQIIVLKSIASMAEKHKPIFESYLKSFYVHSTDSSLVKRYKLEILTILANASNISIILREFQTYVLSPDREFAAHAIHAIGRCAGRISEVTGACLNGLVALMSKKDESTVAESVVVIKKLLQINPSQYSEIIKQIVRMVDKVTVPAARASILWLIGEYSDRISQLAPDVLRKMAKTFPDEEISVKYQILNLAAKLFVVNSKQTHLLVQYVFNLAKYDTNYDIRDKARLLRALLIQTDKCPTLSKQAKKILLAAKPAPFLESIIRDNDQYTLGTLSYVIGQKAMGYKDLPAFPDQPPDSSVRDVEAVLPSFSMSGVTPERKQKASVGENFYSDDDEEDPSTEGPDTEDDEEDEDEDEDEEEEEEEKPVANSNEYEQLEPPSTSPAESEESESEEDSESEESSEEDEDIAVNAYTIPAVEKSLLDMDLEAFLGSTSAPSHAPSKPTLNIFDDLQSLSAASSSAPTSLRHYECLNRIAGHGLQIQYRFPRTAFTQAPTMVHLELVLTNTTSDRDITSIEFLNAKSTTPMQEFETIAELPREASIVVSMGIDFNDTTQPASFDIAFDGHPSTISIPCHVGELIEQKFLSEQAFQQHQATLRGMNEVTDSLPMTEAQLARYNFHAVQSSVLQCASFASVPSSSGDSTSSFRFSGQTIHSKVPVLLTVQLNVPRSSLHLTLHSDRILLATMLLKEMKDTFSC